MYFILRYQKGFALLLCCIICCTNIVLGQTKQAAQNYEAGLRALGSSDKEKAIEQFKLAFSKDSQYLDPAIALFLVYHDQKDFQKASQYYFQIKKIDSTAAMPFIVKQGIALASLGQYDAAYKLI
jgi:tetratricopeptide (TPR) repeat protein